MQASQFCTVDCTLKKEQPRELFSTSSLDVIDYSKEDSDCCSVWIGVIQRHFESIRGH